MNYLSFIYKSVPAIFLTAGTLFLFSCSGAEPEPTIDDPETTPTQISYNHRLINSVNGLRKYRMETPLLERYELAAEPFMEFTRGIKVETFTDSLVVETEIIADYAHLNETTEVWTAKGNVVVTNFLQDRILYTERLYWDQNRQKIYNDTTAKIIDGGNVHYGRNFEADEGFESWSFHNTVGQIEFDAQVSPRDTTAADTTVTVLTGTVSPAGRTPVPRPADNTAPAATPVTAEPDEPPVPPDPF